MTLPDYVTGSVSGSVACTRCGVLVDPRFLIEHDEQHPSKP